MPGPVGEEAEDEVARDLAREEHAGERGHPPGRRLPGPQGIDRVEAPGHGADRGEGAGNEEPAQVAVTREQGGDPAQIGAHRLQRDDRGGGRLPDQGQRHVRQAHAERGAEEADAVARRRRHPGEKVGGAQAADQAPGAAQDIGHSEEPTAQRGRNRPAHDVHPGRHEHAARARHDQEQQEQRGQGDGGRRSGHEEGDEGQCQKRNALPEREAHDEGQLARKRLRMPGREERRQEPSQRHDGGDGADHDVGRAEMGGERGQDGRLRREGQPHEKQRKVRAERDGIVPDIAPGESGFVREEDR